MSTLVEQIMRAHVEVARGDAGAQARLEELQREYRTSGSIVRTGGRAAVVERDVTPSPRPRRGPTRSDLPYGHPPEAVEIRTHSTQSFTVDLSSSAKEWITDEIGAIRRSFGEDRETGGWLLLATDTPRLGSRHDRPRDHGRRLAARTALGHLRRRPLRDRPSLPGSPVPSANEVLRRLAHPPEPRRHDPPPTGMHAPGRLRWIETGLDRYVGLIVSPSETQGWLLPVFSAWTVRREGVPSVPVCEPARLEW